MEHHEERTRARDGVATAMLIGLAAICLPGCGSSSNSDEPDPPKAWSGPTPHFDAVGTINGESIDIHLSGDAAKDSTQLWCEREYQVPSDASGTPIYAQGHNSEFRIVVGATMGRKLEIAYKMHQFQADKAGTAVTVIPRDDNDPPCTVTGCSQPKVMWLSWKWINPADNSVLYKQAALSGKFTLGEFTGSVDSNGLMITENTGKVGGFAAGEWSASESVSITVDANCTTNNLDNG
jgi:hypothetical protein